MTARPGVARSAVSPAIAQILREEAEREEAARRAEAQPLETQPELGLETQIDLDRQRAEEARRRMARMRGEAALPVAAVVPPAPPPRRDRLPDIEEINSTLRSTADRAATLPASEAEIVRSRRRGFRSGFMTVLVMALILALIYAVADPIAAAIPPVKPTLDTYVAAVDSGRLWLDLRLQDLLIALRGDAPALGSGG